MRNIIGRDADLQVKTRMLKWLKDRCLSKDGDPFSGGIGLGSGYEMVFGSEPDIAFLRHGNLVATIEIKGGRDPAGALERLGAARKSFEATPPGCINFLIAGVITEEMRRRLERLGSVKVFDLDDVVVDGPAWYEFLDEVFHHTVRIVEREIRQHG